MTLLKKAENQQAYLKAGIFGFAGSGKTFTASMLAIGISKILSDGKPIAFFDTETGSDFLIPRFKTEGIELLSCRSQSFADLLDVGEEAKSKCSVLIVDSITHIWRDLCESYRIKRNVKKLEFHHWNDIKGSQGWLRWTNFFLNSRLHVIVCGRAGNEYDYQVDEQTGKKELIKGDTKMKAEAEFGFEPSLVFEMSRPARSLKGGYIHVAEILKDRTQMLNGEFLEFDRPEKVYKKGDWKIVFEKFRPIFNELNLGGNQLGVDTTRNSQGMFDAPGEYQMNLRKRAQIALEEIQGTLVKVWPGQDATSKKLKSMTIELLFGTKSWTAVEEKPLKDLDNAVRILSKFEILALEGPIDESNLVDNLSMAEGMAAPAIPATAATSLENDELPS